MKEPSVAIQMIVEDTAAPVISGDRIAGGVIIAECGTLETKLFNSSTEVLREFTKSGAITRQTDITLIHAAAIADVMPVLLKRSYEDDGTRAGFGVYKKSVSNDQVVNLDFNNIADFKADKFLEIKEENVLIGKVKFTGDKTHSAEVITEDDVKYVKAKEISFSGTDKFNRASLSFYSGETEAFKSIPSEVFDYAYITHKNGEESYVNYKKITFDDEGGQIMIDTGDLVSTDVIMIVLKNLCITELSSIIHSDTINYAEVYIKNEEPLTFKSVIQFADSTPNPMNFVIAIGGYCFYNAAQPTPSISGFDLVAIEGIDRFSTTRDIVDAINKQLKIGYVNYDGTNFEVFTTESLDELPVTPGINNTVSEGVSIVLEAGEGFSLMVYANFPSAVDFTAKVEKNSTDDQLIDLTVVTATRTYEYSGSTDPEYVNAYGANQYIENVNEYEGIPFTVKVIKDETGKWTPASEILNTPTIAFGKLNISKGTAISTRKATLEELTEYEGVKMAFLCPFGYVNNAYLNKLTTYNTKIWAFSPIGLYVYKDDPEAIIASKPAVGTEYALLMAPHDKSNLMTDWYIDMTLEVAYLTKIQSNAAKSCEFAPFMGKVNGLLTMAKPSVKFKRSTREKLLDARIMSVISRTSEGINYLNKNKCSAGDTVLSEDQNARLACKINRDLDTLLEPFVGKFNTEETRSKVLTAINNYFTNNILNQVYSIDGYNVICDETNNPASIRANNQLVVDLTVTYLNAIYEVLVYHRAINVAANEAA